VVWPASTLGTSVGVDATQRADDLRSPVAGDCRPISGATLLARSRLAERMQAIRDEGQRLSLDVVSARSAATSPPATPTLGRVDLGAARG
jgi:hypothetical protein